MNKKEKETRLLAMPLFVEKPIFNIDAYFQRLKQNWKLLPNELEGDSLAFSFYIKESEVIMGYVDASIPLHDLNSAMELNKNRIYTPEKTNIISGHYIISIASGSESMLNNVILLTKLINTFLFCTNSIGVYIGTQNLLLSKEFYLETSDYLRTDDLPIDLWVYFGLADINQNTIQYTNGLNQFGKPELQMIGGILDETYNLIYSIAKYIITNDIELKNRELIAFNEQKFSVKKSISILFNNACMEISPVSV